MARLIISRIRIVNIILMANKDKPNQHDFFLTLSDWYIIYNRKRQYHLLEFTDVTALDNSPANKIFIELIKRLVKYNTFDLSRISYLALLFLSPYIDPHLKHALRNLGMDVIYHSEQHGEQQSDHHYLPPLDTTISNILQFIINYIITLELSLNIHMFILYMHIHNLASHNTNTCRSNNSTSKLKKNLATMFETTGISKSTLLLLVMKIANQISDSSIWSILSPELLKELLDNKKQEHNHETIKKYSSSTHKLLDDFIIQLMNPSIVDSDNPDSLWTICKSHLANIMRAGIIPFKLGLDLLINHLVKDTPKCTFQKLSSITNSIINFLEMEITRIEEKLTSC